MTAAIYEYVVRSSHLWQNVSTLQGLRLGLKWQMGRASLCAVSFVSLSIIYKSWLFFPSLCLPVPQRWIWNQTISGWNWCAFAKCLAFEVIGTILCSKSSCRSLNCSSCCQVSLYVKTTETELKLSGFVPEWWKNKVRRSEGAAENPGPIR